MAIVSHYGIHWMQGVAFLMQGRSGANAIGLKAKVPFDVRLPNQKNHCNHQIPLATPVPNDHHWDFFLEFLGDPLFEAMLPIPKPDAGSYYLVDERAELNTILVLLSKMSSPIHNVVVPLSMTNQASVFDAMQGTNVQPLVYTAVEQKHGDLLSQVDKVAAQLPSKIVFSGSGNVPLPSAFTRVSTTLHDKYDLNELIALPWESLGATVVRKYMRDEWPPQEGDTLPGLPRASSRRRLA